MSLWRLVVATLGEERIMTNILFFDVEGTLVTQKDSRQYICRGSAVCSCFTPISSGEPFASVGGSASKGLA